MVDPSTLSTEKLRELLAKAEAKDAAIAKEKANWTSINTFFKSEESIEFALQDAIELLKDVPEKIQQNLNISPVLDSLKETLNVISNQKYLRAVAIHKEMNYSYERDYSHVTSSYRKKIYIDPEEPEIFAIINSGPDTKNKVEFGFATKNPFNTYVDFSEEVGSIDKSFHIGYMTGTCSMNVAPHWLKAMHAHVASKKYNPYIQIWSDNPENGGVVYVHPSDRQAFLESLNQEI